MHNLEVVRMGLDDWLGADYIDILVSTLNC